MRKTIVKLEKNINTKKKEKIQTQKSVNVKDKKSWLAMRQTQDMVNWIKVED